MQIKSGPQSAVSLRREPDSVWDQVLQKQPSIGARFRIPIQTPAYLLIVERSRTRHDGQDLRTRHMDGVREAQLQLPTLCFGSLDGSLQLIWRDIGISVSQTPP
jgi:hypothetical protein